MIAFVESRSWTNRGSVGTSNESRSALPAQLRNGRPSRLQSLDRIVQSAAIRQHMAVGAAELEKVIPLYSVRRGQACGLVDQRQTASRPVRGCCFARPSLVPATMTNYNGTWPAAFSCEIAAGSDLGPQRQIGFRVFVGFGAPRPGRAARHTRPPLVTRSCRGCSEPN